MKKTFLDFKGFLVSKYLVFLAVGLLIIVCAVLISVAIISSRVGGLDRLVDGALLESFNIRNLKLLQNEPEKVLFLQDLGESVPKVSAGGVWVEDLTAGKVLYEYNSDVKLLPASTTKMMTALVGIEYFRYGDDLVVTREALVSGSSMGLNENERLSFRAILYGMLLNSGNDAAYTIAINYPGGLDGFMAAMNKKSQSLGLTNSYFTNPAGFDTPGHYSSAKDLAIIAKAVMANEQLAQVVGTKETTVIAENQTKSHTLENLNQLLGEDGVIGIKTGYTEKSGENLVTLVERDGRQVLIVVLRSSDRFGETKKLIQWAYRNFSLEWR